MRGCGDGEMPEGVGGACGGEGIGGGAPRAPKGLGPTVVMRSLSALSAEWPLDCAIGCGRNPVGVDGRDRWPGGNGGGGLEIGRRGLGMAVPSTALGSTIVGCDGLGDGGTGGAFL